MRALRVLLAAAVAALSVVASAQEGLRDRDPNFEATRRIANDLTQSTFHYGPFYLLSRFQLSDLGYSQELFLPVATTPGGLQFAVSAPQRLYFIPQKKVVLSAEVVPSYAIVDQSGTKNQFGWTARGDAQFLLNHLYLDFYGLGYNDLRASNVEIAHVITERAREAGMRSELKYSSRTSLLFSAAHATRKHPTNGVFQPDVIVGEVPRLDRTENRFRASIDHKTFPLTALTLAGELNQYKFPNDPLRDAHRTYAGGGFRFNNGRTTWQLEAGPAKLDFRNTAVKDYSGFLGNTTVEHALGTRTRLVAGAARDVEFSLYGPNGYYLLDRVQATAEYSASRRVTLRLLSQEGRDTYNTPVAGIDRRDTYTFNGAGWLYSLRRLRAGFDVGYFHRSSNTPGIEPEHGIRVLLHLSFTP